MSIGPAEAFGVALKREREKRKLSQMASAQKANLHLNTWVKLETEKGNPSLHTIFAVCHALDLPVGKFMSLVESYCDD